jgi:hypothetical protein
MEPYGGPPCVTWLKIIRSVLSNLPHLFLRHSPLFTVSELKRRLEKDAPRR